RSVVAPSTRRSAGGAGRRSHGLPAILYDVKSRGSEAYLALARELLAREASAPGAAAPTGEGHMADKRPALGRGLSALIPDSPPPPPAAATDRSLEIDSDLLRPNKFQPRTQMD